MGKKRITIISPDSAKNKQALQFIKYQVSDKIIKVEMHLFQENILFQGKYKKHKDSLKELFSNVIFSKKPVDDN